MIHLEISVYLLDDVLSAVDTHVAKHIIKHCLLDLIKQATRIIITEDRTLTYHACQVLHVADGTVRPSEVNPEDYDDDDGYMEMYKMSQLDFKIDKHFDDDTKSLDSVMHEVING